ncbi:MAG: ribosome biogenesis GTPase Der [Alphaproteobacteria bacterium]|nr:ribosome biogenesis GTPase Der [Alphaproteobacteria bacterium]
MSFTVAILGRPNVGKSTLFNRLVGRREALVAETPGVTRDRRVGAARIGDLRFRVIDTAGLEEAADETLEARMRTQTERALADADVALMLIDARAGLTPVDRHFADWLRKQGVPVILVANKCEGRVGAEGALEAYALGLGEPIAISAEHGEGLADLFEALAPFEDAAEDVEEEAAGTPDEVQGEDEGGPLRLAIVGRPNVGKSTLANRLLGEERMITGPEAGITRDAVSVDWDFGGRAIRLVDTAGLRKKAKVTAKLERLSVTETQRAIRLAAAVILVIDARDGLERQDLAIARMTVDEGRALVIAANKWDVTEDRSGARRAIDDALTRSLPQARGVRVVPVSALTGQGLDTLMQAVFAADEVWNRRIATGPLNRWLADVLEHHPPPLAAGRRLRLRYITQIKARPPTFAIWASRPKELPAHYLSYLINGLRTTFDLPGTPIRILLRKGKNPYAEG